MRFLSLHNRAGRLINVLMDDEDYDAFSQHKWQLAIRERSDGTEALVVKRKRLQGEVGGQGKTAYLAREILEAAGHRMEGLVAHLIDPPVDDVLDYRRSNLQPITKSISFQKRSSMKAVASGTAGVTWYRRNRKWRAQVSMPDGTTKHVGFFRSIEEAADARARFLRNYRALQEDIKKYGN